MAFKDNFRKGVLWASAGVKRASAYAVVLNEMGNAPGAHNYIAAGIKLAKVGFEHIKERTFDISQLQKFSFMGGLAKDDVDDLVIKLARPVGEGSIEKSTSFLIGDNVLHVIPDERSMYCGKEVNLDNVKDCLASLIWGTSKGLITLLPETDYYPHAWNLSLNGMGDVYESEYSHQVIQRVSRFLERGKSRSILLYGNPGSGKTCIAYAVASAFAEKTLVIGCATGMSPGRLLPAVKDLKPDLVILNEIDKVLITGGLLELLENLKTRVKVIIGTSNAKNSLPGAFLRPGRFDELINVDKIDGMTLKNLVNFPCSEEMMADLREWPVAFVSELRSRYDVDPEFLQEHYLSLKERVEFNQKKEEEKK